MPRLARFLGLATAAFGAATIVRPEIVALPVGLANRPGAVPDRTRLLISLIGGRDIAVGLGMAVAPPGPALRWLVAARVASDAGDAVFLVRHMPDPVTRAATAAIAGGWATLCAVSWYTAGRDEEVEPGP